MIRALLASLALLVAMPASAQHVGDMLGSKSRIEFLEEFEGVYTGEAFHYRHSLWEGSFYSANTSMHMLELRSGTRFAAAGIGSVAFNGNSTFGPVSTGGFNLDGSSGDNSGIEIWSNDFTTGYQPIVTGVDAAEFCVELKINGNAGIDHFEVGWRRWDSGTGVPDDATGDDYTDKVALGFVGADTGGVHDIYTIEIKNDAATVQTDTTDNAADDTSIEYCTTINADLSYSQTIDGAAPSATPSTPITVVTGELMKPYLRFVKDADFASLSQFLVTKWEVRKTN